MSVLEGVRSYHSLFGFPGLYLVAKARLLRRPIEVKFSAPGFRDPLHLRVRTSDISLFQEILINMEYDWELARSPKVIVDAGANVGLTSVFYANKYPDAKIVSVEPEPSNFAMLKKNTASYSNIVTVQAALWKENTELNIFDPGQGHWGFQTGDVRESAAVEKQRPVHGTTVDKLMEDNGIGYIDLLKVDIEGSEKEVFEHSLRWIDRVGVIVIELHDRFKTGCSESVHSAAKHFECEWQRGETTFLLRKEYVVGAPSPAHVAAPSSGASRSRSRCKLPLKIDWAA